MEDRPEDRTRSHWSTVDQTKRKRLGQYFTGLQLARLLAILGNAGSYHHIIDPMCGIGDMLAAANDISPSAELYGIEIDQNVYAQCLSQLQNNRIKQSHIIYGNAFDESSIAQLPRRTFDLVITNPPYVRYQTLSSNGIGNKSASLNAEVRSGLARIADTLETLDTRTKEVFKTLINGYSGLSDLAVPSWLLCAMLTRVGGTIAMVVPASWLSRDYSQVIHYLLLKLFRIRYVVEDAHSVWFDDALVNTTLLIAERIPIVDNLDEHWEHQNYVHVIVSGQAANERSVVGALFPDAEDPDTAFGNYLKSLEVGGEPRNIEFVSITRHSLKQKYENLIASAGTSGWLLKLESSLLPSDRRLHHVSKSLSPSVLPQRLKDLLPASYTRPFTTLQEIGLRVGQGLRTGANRFFYVDVIEANNSRSRIRVDDVFGVAPFEIENDLLKRVLRKQSEVLPQFELASSHLTGRVLVLEGYVLPEDFDKIVGQRRMPFVDQPLYNLLNEDLAHYVRVAATTNTGTDDDPRYVPELSAVKTNETRLGRSTDRPQRFWYMLPAFAPRHIPDLFVARINHLHPRVIKNSQEKTIIDANFSTFWMEGQAITNVFGFLALLNSSWCVTAMELIGTVMGGGALKLEATHLKQLPIPFLSTDEWKQMSYYGEQLSAGHNVESNLERIDSIIASAFCSSNQNDVFNTNLRLLNDALLQTRTRGNV